jgi:hypothetical protein
LREGNHDHPEDLLADLIEGIVPERLKTTFAFHAADLYQSAGPFNGLARAKATETLEACLHWIAANKIPIVFGAVDITSQSDGIREHPHPAAAAFTICAKGAELWMRENATDRLGVVIVDSSAGPDVRQAVQTAFRDLRRHVHAFGSNRLVLKHFHDDLYFGDSACSFGVQAADICAWFIYRHIGGLLDTERFYSIIESNIFHFRIVPDRNTTPVTSPG